MSPTIIDFNREKRKIRYSGMEQLKEKSVMVEKKKKRPREQKKDQLKLTAAIYMRRICRKNCIRGREERD